jgi:hypothetical protein
VADQYKLVHGALRMRVKTGMVNAGPRSVKCRTLPQVMPTMRRRDAS